MCLIDHNRSAACACPHLMKLSSNKKTCYGKFLPDLTETPKWILSDCMSIWIFLTVKQERFLMSLKTTTWGGAIFTHDSSTLRDTDKFFKYVIGYTLLLIILFTFFSCYFLFWCVSTVYLYRTGRFATESALSKNDDVSNLHNKDVLNSFNLLLLS